MEFLKKLQSSIEKNGKQVATYINKCEENRENMLKENREKLKELKIEFNNIKIYKKYWLIYFIAIFLSTIILVPVIETIPLIIGCLIATTIGAIGTFIEINKEEKRKHLQEKIRNLTSKIMWEPNEEIAKYCAERTVEFILGNQKYTLQQLEAEEKPKKENNISETSTEIEEIKNYSLYKGRKYK